MSTTKPRTIPFKKTEFQAVICRLDYKTVLIQDLANFQFYILMFQEEGQWVDGWYFELELYPHRPHRVIPGAPLSTIHMTRPDLVDRAQKVVDSVGPFLR